MKTDPDNNVPTFLRLTAEQRLAGWAAYDQRRNAAAAALGSVAAAAPATPRHQTATAGAQPGDERTLIDEAERRWRDWRPSNDGRERSRPQLRSFVRIVRRERRLAAKAAAKEAAKAARPSRTRPAEPRVSVNDGLTFAARLTTAIVTISRASGAVDKATKAIALMQRTGGASVAELTEATGWKPHTLRARISGLRKPKTEGGHALDVTRTENGYMIKPTTEA